MIEFSNIIPPIEYAKELAIKSEKYVMYIRADGPMKCSDSEKIEEIWEFYQQVCDGNVYSILREYGECVVYFEGKNYAKECLDEWFPQKKLLNDIEYDLDLDYYIYVDLYTPDGNGLGFN